MTCVEFNYNSMKTIIQCIQDDKMEDIIQKFLAKCEKKMEDLFFIYDGKILDIKKTFKEATNNLDKNRNKISVIVNDIQVEEKHVSSLKKAKYFICPKCNENIYFSIKDYKIFLKDCKNGYKMDDILFNEFEKTQYIDQTKIKCDNCKNTNKNETFKNQFFICFSCNIFLCPLCKNSHNKDHYIIDFDQKDFTCRDHKESYISYCSDCKKDLCVLCLKDHGGHEVISYGDIIPDIAELEKELNKLKESIKKHKSNGGKIK